MSLVKIRNHYLEDITWLAPGSDDFNIQGLTDIWRINISANLALLDDLDTLLNVAEIERANRYLQTRDRNRFIISRGALRIILARYLNQQPWLIEFETGVNKKPFLKDLPIHYNVSHSGDWIVIAVANTPVGVDIEQLDPTFDYHDIITEYFSAEEARYITGDDTPCRFFLLWTRKEALTKATGKGLDDDLKLIPALDGDHIAAANLFRPTSNWQLNSFALSPGYLAACAVAATTGELRFREADLSSYRS